MPKFQKKAPPSSEILVGVPGIIVPSEDQIKQSMQRLQEVVNKSQKKPLLPRILRPFLVVLSYLLKASMTILATIGAAGLVAIFITAVGMFTVKLWSYL